MIWLLVFVLALTGCGPKPAPAPQPKPDPTKEAWYGETTKQLAMLAREADAAFQRGQKEQTAALIEKGQPLIHRLLSAPYPTLEAMEAVSDLDELYGRMLLSNGRYAWARVFFQKNLTRWSLWKPRTADTQRRLETAKGAAAECDRHIGE